MTDRQMAPEPRVLNLPRRAVEHMLDLDAGKTPARVLFATSSERPSPDAVQHARDFAQAVGAEMHVLYLASEPSRATQLELDERDANATRPTGPTVVHAEAVLVHKATAPLEERSEADDAASASSQAAVQRVALPPPAPRPDPGIQNATHGGHAANGPSDTSLTTDSQSASQAQPSAQAASAQSVSGSAASVIETASVGAASSTVAATGVTSFTPSWCDEIFPEELRSTRVCVRAGDFTSTVCEHAEAIGASLIIVSGYERPGGRVTALARAAAVPVLVARARAAQDTTILAATDLSDEQFPILHLAYKLGGLTQAPLVAVHNVAPKSTHVPVRARSQTQAIATPDPAVVTKRLEMLVDVTSKLGFETAVLSSMLDPVDAVVREAKARHVDTIVVGTRAPLPGERASVAAQIINLATQSVLVIPLELTDPATTRPHSATKKLFAIESSV